MRFRLDLVRPAEPFSQDLVVVGQPGAVLVAGPPGAIESLVARFVEVAGTGARSVSAGGAADLVATAVTTGIAHHISELAKTSSGYVRLTPRSMQLLKEHGLVPGEGGSFWGFVRDSDRIRGVLNFEKVDFGAQQMLALQTAAATFALRAAIKEVQAAVERVEGKVDDLLGLLRAERVGDVLGTKRILDPLVDRVRREGRISTTDWSAAAALGADIARAIETLRAHIRSRLEAADGGWRPGDRANDAERLFERRGLMTESLALLVVAEHNLGAWHELRIAHVRINEAEDLAWTLEDAQAAVTAQTEYDQAIADALRMVAEKLTTPQWYDGLAPWQRRELTEARTKLDELAGWFADQRLLDLAPLGDLPYPTATESFRHVTHDVGDLADRSFDAVRDRLRRQGGLRGLAHGVGDRAGRSLDAVRGRLGPGRDSDTPELPPGDPPGS